MPEHVHLLVYPRGPKPLGGKIAGQIQEAGARRAIGHLEGHAPHRLPRITVGEGGRALRRFWQRGGGHDRNGVAPSTAHERVEYTHANPLRRGWVATAEQWE